MVLRHLPVMKEAWQPEGDVQVKVFEHCLVVVGVNHAAGACVCGALVVNTELMSTLSGLQVKNMGLGA